MDFRYNMPIWTSTGLRWMLGEPRNVKRKQAKLDSRKRRIRNKIILLLDRCPSSIIEEKYLSKEEIEELLPIYRAARNAAYDYYPVPKVIHNKIRRWVHMHGRLGRERSLEDILYHMLAQEGIGRNSLTLNSARFAEYMRHLENIQTQVFDLDSLREFTGDIETL